MATTWSVLCRVSYLYDLQSTTYNMQKNFETQLIKVKDEFQVLTSKSAEETQALTSKIAELEEDLSLHFIVPAKCAASRSFEPSLFF